MAIICGVTLGCSHAPDEGAQLATIQLLLMLSAGDTAAVLDRFDNRQHGQAFIEQSKRVPDWDVTPDYLFSGTLEDGSQSFAIALSDTLALQLRLAPGTSLEDWRLAGAFLVHRSEL